MCGAQGSHPSIHYIMYWTNSSMQNDSNINSYNVLDFTRHNSQLMRRDVIFDELSPDIHVVSKYLTHCVIYSIYLASDASHSAVN